MDDEKSRGEEKLCINLRCDVGDREMSDESRVAWMEREINVWVLENIKP